MKDLKDEMTTQDKIEKIGHGSIIQHGKVSNRVYLMKLHQDDFGEIILMINQLAIQENYTKLFCKIPHWAAPLFTVSGFITEAIIPRFYNNDVDAFFMAKYLNIERQRVTIDEPFKLLSSQLLGANANITIPSMPKDFESISIKPAQAALVSELYKKVFESYPFPIFDSNYIKETMDDNIQYFGIKHEGKLIALASAEADLANKNAEMTDFATLPEYRGNNLAIILLHQMEQEMQKQNFRTLYTIARLHSPAMNRTFQKLNYNYAGTLINNTHIAGQIESMVVYYKNIKK